MSRKQIKGRVSIVVTNHNRQAYIIPCLESLVHQSYPHIEIIVVDDHSSDQSRSKIRAWRKGLPDAMRHRVYLVSLPRNAGYSGALTTAMFLARGEYIAIQDGDDLSQPDRIQKQVEFLRAHKDTGAVGTNYAMLRGGRIRPKETATWLAYGWPRIRKIYASGGHCVSVPTVMFRSELFRKYGGLTNRIHGAEDYELIANWISHGERVDNLKAVLYTYRKHEQQRSRQFYGN